MAKVGRQLESGEMKQTKKNSTISKILKTIGASPESVLGKKKTPFRKLKYKVIGNEVSAKKKS